MLFRDAITVFIARNAAGEIPDGTTGQPRVRAPNRVEQIISAVRTTLEAIPTVPDPLAVDLRAYQQSLPGLAFETAKDAMQARPANKRSDVALFLRVTLGVKNGREKAPCRPKGMLEHVPVAWRTMAAPVFGAVAGTTRARNGYRSRLLTFIDAMVIGGIHQPANLPATREALLAILEKAGHSEDQRSHLLSAYRDAVGAAGLNLPLYLPAAQARERCLRSLPDLQARCVTGLARLHREDPAAPGPDPRRFELWSPREILMCLAPELSADLEEYMAWAEGAGGRSEGRNDQAVDAIASLVTELLRLGYEEEAWQLNALDVFLERRPARGILPVNARVARRGGGGGAPLSLARIALDEAARRSAEHTVLDVATTLPVAPVAHYTAAVRNQFSVLRSIVVYVHDTVGQRHALEPGKWTAYLQESAAIDQAIHAVNATSTTSGHKAKGLLPLTWAQAVFVLLHRSWQGAQRARRDFFAAADRGQATRARALREYSHALREYLLAALYLLDGMRGRNYGYGRLNVNFKPTWVEHDGQLVGIRELRVVFDGQDPIARPKHAKGRAVGGNASMARQRTGFLNSTLVDLELVADYVLLVRPFDLVRAGRLTTEAEYDPRTDCHAFIVNPTQSRGTQRRSHRKARRTHRADASYSLPHLSKRFGLWLLRGTRDVLQLPDTEGHPLPTKEELEADTPEGIAVREKWRGLFSGHIARTLIASYIGGRCGLWDTACAMTDDTEHTLKNVYTVNYARYFERLRMAEGIYHLDHFKAITIMAFTEPVTIDWARFDPARPNEALVRIAPRGTRPAA